MENYLSLSTSLRDVLPLVELLDKFQYHDYKLVSIEPNIYFKAFEYNSGALKIARLLKMLLRT